MLSLPRRRVLLGLTAGIAICLGLISILAPLPAERRSHLFRQRDGQFHGLTAADIVAPRWKALFRVPEGGTRADRSFGRWDGGGSKRDKTGSPSPAPPTPEEEETGPTWVWPDALVETKINGHSVLVSNPEIVPPSSADAVALLFHGCSHDGNVWRAAPLERHLIAELLKENTFIVSLTSSSNAIAGSSQCWDTSTPAHQNPDILAAVEVVKGLKNLVDGEYKLVGIGASSGGWFLSLLSLYLKFDVIGVYIAGMHPAVEKALLPPEGPMGEGENKLTRPRIHLPSLDPLPPGPWRAAAYPTVVWVLMTGDEETMRGVEKIKGVLIDGKGMSREGVTEIDVPPRPLTPISFHVALPSRLTARGSTRLVGVLEGGGVLVREEPGSGSGSGGGIFGPETPPSYRLTTNPRSKEVGALIEVFMGGVAPASELDDAVVDLSLCGDPHDPTYLCYADDIPFDVSSGSIRSSLRHQEVEGEADEAAAVEAALDELRAGVQEILNDVYAEHEFTADSVREVVDALIRLSN